MPKWVRRIAAIAAAISASGIGLAAAARASTPTIVLGPAHVAITLPSGCHANRFQVANSSDGSYHGYLQASCDGKGRFFYISRSPAGTWALRTTTIDIQIPLATTTDNTGTYFVGIRSNHDLVLVRRNGDGSLSQVHVLQKYQGPAYSVDSASVIASNGNYWATWSTSFYDVDTRDTTASQARTMAPAIAPRAIGTDLWYDPMLVARPGSTTQLIANTESADFWPPDEVTYGAVVAAPNGNDWTVAQRFPNTASSDLGSAIATYHAGHTYYGYGRSPSVYDDRSGSFQATQLSGNAGTEAVLGMTSTRVAYVGSTAFSNDYAVHEAEWLQNPDGTFTAAPTGILSPAPVPVRFDQVMNRSGKLIRLFDQEDTTRHIGGTRLLEQIQK